MRLLRQLPPVLLFLAFCGCAGYRLGPVNGVAAGEKSIQVRPVLNQTLEPRLGDAATMALRRQLQRDGTYSLSTHGGADIVLNTVLTRYERHELSLLPNDVLTVRDYRVSVTAQVSARETGSGKLLVDQTVTAYTLVRVGSDLTSSERQALPVLADGLAKNITALLAEGSW